MTSLIIEDGVQIIANYAFYFNEYLLEVTMSTSVLSIGPSAFRHNSKLEKFDYNGKLQYLGADVFKKYKNEKYLSNKQLPK